MSGRRRFAAAFLGLTLTAGACSITIGSPPVTRDPSPSPVPTGPGSAAAAMRQLCDAPKPGNGSDVTPEGPTPPAIAIVEQQVEAVRDLKYTSHVAVQPVTQAQIDRRLTKNFDKTYPVDFYARRSDAWGTIGVVPAGTSIRDALLAFQTGQVVGFYNHGERAARIFFFVPGDGGLEVARVGQAIGADRPAVGQRELGAVVFADVAARGAVDQFDAEFDAARDDADIAGRYVDAAELGEKAQARLLRHDQQLAVGVVEVLVHH